MNSVKRVLAVALALVMMVSIMTVSAFATSSSTVVPVTTHPYDAYQILEGEIDSNGGLTKIKWGSGIDVAGFIADFNKIDSSMQLASDAKGSDFALLIKDITPDSETARKIAKAAYDNKTTPTCEDVRSGENLGNNAPAGYYLMVDVSNTPEKNLSLLRMYDGQTGIQISNKVDSPTMTKKVKDIYDTTGVESGWQDGADYDIGDYVPFKLEAQLATIKDYESYTVEFMDTLSAGLTFVNDEDHPVSVKIVNGTNEIDATDDFGVKSSGQNVSFWCWDVKDAGAQDDARIVVEFYAQLNTSADIGRDGNDNVAKLVYSCNPNESKPVTDDVPPSESDKDNPSTETPDDKVTVFTYAFKVSKVDQDERPLEGAEFALLKVLPGVDSEGNPNTEPVGNASVNGNVFTWVGLDDGTYILKETKAPDNYNPIDDVTFTVTAGHTEIESRKDVITLNSLRTDKEDLIEVCDLADAELSGYMLSTIINQFGATLPSTGGDGMSTAFYAVGGLMVLGAAVVLFSKRKASSK